jgi:hypothetical protein
MLSAAPCRASPMRNPRTRKRLRQADRVGQGSDQVPRLRFDDNWTCDERALRFWSWSGERVVGSGGAGGSIPVGAGSDETRGGPRSPRTSDGVLCHRPGRSKAATRWPVRSGSQRATFPGMRDARVSAKRGGGRSRPVRCLAALCALAAVAASTGVGWAGISNKAEAAGRLGLVDPMIGTAGGGNTVPGPSAPFGFARPSPDTTDLDLAEPVSSGYNPGGRIVGFSQTHVSGTGGGSKYGNFILAPFTGSGRRLFDGSSKAREQASAGRYAVDLTRYDIHAELTATRLAAVHRYRFPRTEGAKVMLDASSVIALLTPPNRQRPVRTVLCPAGRRGFDATVSAVDGWLHPGRYTLHAAVRFDRPVRGARRHCAAAGPGRHLRAVARFDARRRRVVRVKVGLSFIGGRKALRNLRREIPDWRFRSVRLAAESAGAVCCRGWRWRAGRSSSGGCWQRRSSTPT